MSINYFEIDFDFNNDYEQNVKKNVIVLKLSLHCVR